MHKSDKLGSKESDRVKIKFILERMRKGTDPSVCRELLGYKNKSDFKDFMNRNGYTEDGIPITDDDFIEQETVDCTAFDDETDKLLIEYLKNGMFPDNCLEKVGFPLNPVTRKHIQELNKQLSDSYNTVVSVTSNFMPVCKKE